MRRVGWTVGIGLTLLGLFDVPDQLRKLGDFFAALAEWVTKVGLDQNLARWVLVGLGLGVLVVPELIRRLSSSPASPAPQPSEGSPAAPQREFVSQTIREICELQRGQTEIRAKQLIEPFKGKWMRVTGKVTNVSNEETYGRKDPEKIIVVLDTSTPEESENRWRTTTFDAMAYFDKRRWGDALSVLALDTRLTAVGQISYIHRDTISLVDCELVGIEPTPPAPPPVAAPDRPTDAKRSTRGRPKRDAS